MNFTLNVAQVITAVATVMVNTGTVKAAANTPNLEAIGARCEAGLTASCKQLVKLTGGQCAGPKGSGCRYDSAVYVDNGLMVEVPGYGKSRVETVTFCLNDAGVERYQDLTTDTEFTTFERCLQENT